MKMSMKVMLSFALLALSASPALAVSVTFDLTGGAGYISTGSQPYVVNSGPLSLEVTGWSHSGGSDANAPFSWVLAEGLHQDHNGMGVRASRLDSNQLDGLGADEMMQLDFGEDVVLESVHLSLATDGDEFDLAVDNVDLPITGMFGSDTIDVIGSPRLGNGISWDYVIDFSVFNIVGSAFQLYTDDWCDGYKVVGVTVSEVPEPATMGLLGLAALSGLAVRRKRAA